MRLTRFTQYSLQVLIYLGQTNNDWVTIQQISETYDISKNHLMKVVSNLTRLQIVVAQRGPGGGIRLNRLPEEISLREVIGNTENHLQQLQTQVLPDTSVRTPENHLDGYLQRAVQTYLEALGRITLADVLKTDNIQIRN